MRERKTISQSKGIFHKEYPYVIPSIYRKVIDEFLVELNLLSNQKDFKLDSFFAFGLYSSFKRFTQGYEPENHLEILLISLCKCCGIDYVGFQNLISKLNNEENKKSIKDIINLVKEKDNNQLDQLGIQSISEIKQYQGRLHAIGIYEFINFTYWF